MKLTKKRFYKQEIESINKRLWRQELRMATIKEIREGIRMQFDRVSGMVQAAEEAIAELCNNANIPIKSLEALKVDVSENPNQTLEIVEQRRVSQWAKETKRLIDLSVNDKNKRKALKEVGKEIFKLYTTQFRNVLDAEKMQEQMVGKWSPKAQAYQGGADQEIKKVKANMAGGEEFQRLIKREIKKL